MKKSENWFFIRFSSLSMFHVNLTTFENIILWRIEWLIIKVKTLEKLWTKSTITQKIEIGKIRKNDFWFDSAYCASSIKMGARLKGLHILSWENPNFSAIKVHIYIMVVWLREPPLNPSITKCCDIRGDWERPSILAPQYQETRGSRTATRLIVPVVQYT